MWGRNARQRSDRSQLRTPIIGDPDRAHKVRLGPARSGQGQLKSPSRFRHAPRVMSRLPHARRGDALKRRAERAPGLRGLDPHGPFTIARPTPLGAAPVPLLAVEPLEDVLDLSGPHVDALVPRHGHLHLCSPRVGLHTDRSVGQGELRRARKQVSSTREPLGSASASSSSARSRSTACASPSPRSRDIWATPTPVHRPRLLPTPSPTQPSGGARTDRRGNRACARRRVRRKGDRCGRFVVRRSGSLNRCSLFRRAEAGTCAERLAVSRVGPDARARGCSLLPQL
jgi:hypothetical protein